MKLVVKILVGLALAVAAYFWAMGLMGALFGFRSPLLAQAPQPLAGTGSPLSNRVTFVLVDGLRLDTALDETVMPTLASLRKQGAWAVSHSRPPSYSQTGYTVLLTGAWPSVSDGPAINLDYADIYTFTQDDLFSAAHRAGMKTAVSGFNWFEKLIPQTAVNATFYTELEDRVADKQVTAAALPWLESDEYQLILIHLDQVDYAGHHEGGAVDQRWDEAARRVDAHLAEIVARLDLGRDTLFLTSDHGHIDRGGHGGQEQVVLVEPFLLVGAGVKPGSYADINMVDIAPTLAVLLGTGIPASAQGQPRLEMLTIDSTIAARTQEIHITQQAHMVGAYAHATGMSIPIGADGAQAALEQAVDQRLVNESLPRLASALLILGLSAWLLRRASPREELPWIAGSIALYWMAFHVKYALLDGRTYSLSSVLSSNDIILTVALNTTLALVAAWGMAAAGLRLWQKPRRAAAEIGANQVLGVLFSLAVIIGWNYFRNGLWPTWTLPADFTSEFLSFLSLLQVLVAGVLLPIVACVSALLGRRK